VSDEQAIESGGLRVVFRRLADRYAHRVELTHSEGAICLLESVEGTAEDDWPPSPPLQELHFEHRGAERQLALLVGRAGASHWSLSIELDSAAATITFDAACRVRSAAERLGSRYRSACTHRDPSGQSTGEPSPALWLQGACWLQADAVQGRPSCELHCDQGELLVTPAQTLGSWPQTARWRYSLAREKAVEAARS